jgi:hypothetical protein
MISYILLPPLVTINTLSLQELACVFKGGYFFNMHTILPYPLTLRKMAFWSELSMFTCLVGSTLVLFLAKRMYSESTKVQSSQLRIRNIADLS